MFVCLFKPHLNQKHAASVFLIPFLLIGPVMLLCLGSPLTPSLPHHVQFLGWKMHAHVHKQYIFPSCNKSPSILHFDGNPFTCVMWKRKRKCLRISNFTYLLVVLKWHDGSERVNEYIRVYITQCSFCERPDAVSLKLWPCGPVKKKIKKNKKNQWD